MGKIWAVKNGRRSLSQTHPEIAAQWHTTKNVGITPQKITISSRENVWWKCTYGHEWLCAVHRRIWSDRKTKGAITHCPHCKKMFGARVDLPKLSQTHPEIAKQWHSKLNMPLTPDHVVSGSDKRAWWQCGVREDHVWQCSIYNRTRHGCPYCANKKVIASNCLHCTHPNIASQWHPIKNGSLTPYDVTAGSSKKFWWKCHVAEDHEWQTSIAHRALGNRNCPCCSGHKVVKSTSIATTHPELAAQWHSKNGTLNPDQVSAGSGLKIWWQCPLFNKHIWQAAPCGRTNGGSGCPFCNQSKGEVAIENFLKQKGIRFEREKTFDSCRNVRPLYFDFVVYKDNEMRIVEFQGQQHYKPVNFGGGISVELFCRVKRNDEIKKEWCNDNDISLLEIPYWDLNNIEFILEKFLWK